MSKRTRRPSMPDPRSPQFLDAVKEVLEQMQGQRGLAMDANVSFRDLVDAGLAEQGPGGTIRPPGAQTDTSPGGSVRDPQVTVPPPVRDIAAGGAFTRVLLTWGPPRYRNHSMVEIARSQDNDIGNSVIIGTTGARTYTDVVGGGFTGFWWLRNVSTAGVRGPWSAPVSASTPRDFDEIQESATSYPWQPSTAYGLFNAVAPTVELFLGTTRVVLVATAAGTSGAVEPDWADEIDEIGDTVTDGTVTWEAVEAGRVPFVIDPVTGLLVIEGAAIRNASINALQVRDGFFDQITAAKGSLGEANISIANIFNALVQNQISSDNFSAGLEGWRISRAGDAEFNNVEMRGRIQNASGRYIDLRPGAPTDGDFVLGNVGQNQFVSYKDEGPGIGRVLRIRGDVYGQDYQAGTQALRMSINNATVGNAGKIGSWTNSPTQMRVGRFGSIAILARIVFERTEAPGTMQGTSRIRVLLNGVIVATMEEETDTSASSDIFEQVFSPFTVKPGDSIRFQYQAQGWNSAVDRIISTVQVLTQHTNDEDRITPFP